MSRFVDVDELLKKKRRIGTSNYCEYDVVYVTAIEEAATDELIPKDQYEARLKADMIARLKEIQQEIEELKNEPACCQHFVRGIRRSSEVIQQKINTLEEKNNDN